MTLKDIPWYVWLIVIILLIYFINRFIRKSGQASNYNAAVGQSQTALNQLSQQGINPSYGQAEYTSMANALEQTFSGCGLGWSDVVVPTFQKMKNDADIYALINAYGVRPIPECGWGTFTGDLASTLAYKTQGLILTLANPSDLFTDASVGAVNKILAQNGLKFQF